MTRLARVILFVKDLDRMTAFYVDIIGLSPADGAEPGFVPLDGEGCQLALHALPPRIARGITITDPPAERADSATKICFYAAAPMDVRAALIAKGVKMRKPMTGGRLVLCDGIDPEGNVFQFSNR